MRRVLYISRILPGYRVPILKELAHRLGCEVHVCHGAPPNDRTALSSLTVEQRDLPSIPITNHWIASQRAIYQNFRNVAREARPGDVVLLEESPRTINLWPFIKRCKKRQIPVILWGHFSSNNRRFNPANLSDQYRIRLANLADACVLYTDDLRDLLLPFVAQDRLFVANNTLDSSPLASARGALSLEGRDKVQRRFGIATGAVSLAYVGRLIPEKGISRLASAVRVISTSRPVSLLVVGDGPEVNEVKQLAEEPHVSVMMVPATTDIDVIAPIVFASDVMVQPGYAGLSINLGMLLGTPVATIPSPGAYRYHSPEIAFLLPGQNGEIADDGSPEALARAILRIVDNRSDYARRAVEFADSNLTTSRMVDGLVQAIRFVEQKESATSDI